MNEIVAIKCDDNSERDIILFKLLESVIKMLYEGVEIFSLFIILLVKSSSRYVFYPSLYFIK